MDITGRNGDGFFIINADDNIPNYSVTRSYAVGWRRRSAVGPRFSYNRQSMLAELAVQNFAVIESARVRFHRGLNLLTGETGSGKSLVVDALALLFGGRASADMIRTGAERGRVSGVFEVGLTPALSEILERAGIWPEDGELLVEREIQAGGKSRALVANHPATTALLKELAPHLGDIHGQHDQQQLFSPRAQLEMLDAFAGAQQQIATVARIFTSWKGVSAELAEIGRAAQEQLQLGSLWAFQKDEIETVAPNPGEDGDLENERRVLRNLVKLQEAAAEAFQSLYEDPGSVTARLRVIVKRVEEAARIDENARQALAALEPASIAADEAAHALRHYLGSLEADPARLDAVESRLAALEKLKRKYGPTLEQVLECWQQVQRDLSAVETSSDRREALEKEIASLARDYEASARKLTALRRDAARQLAKRVETELGALAMDKTRMEIRLSAAQWSETGTDTVEFLLSPNVGEELRPLDKIASGGELSRVALALKTAGAPAGRKPVETPRTLVFDEVDAGIGGSAAEAVGRRLKRLASSHQVICVTHLAQIAGFADHHYFVEKAAVKSRTVATIAELTPPERTREIGRMLSGERVTQEALRHAEQLIKMAAE
jgi:DNA repair protein RecN (Recombination protein N)